LLSMAHRRHTRSTCHCVRRAQSGTRGGKLRTQTSGHHSLHGARTISVFPHSSRPRCRCSRSRHRNLRSHRIRSSRRNCKSRRNSPARQRCPASGHFRGRRVRPRDRKRHFHRHSRPMRPLRRRLRHGSHKPRPAPRPRNTSHVTTSVSCLAPCAIRCPHYHSTRLAVRQMLSSKEIDIRRVICRRIPAAVRLCQRGKLSGQSEAWQT
jgi:hypothetical protein